MKHGHYVIFLQCSPPIRAADLTMLLGRAFGSLSNVRDFTVTPSSTPTRLSVSIGGLETPSRRLYSAASLARWFYNPAMLRHFYHWPQAGLPGWISLSTLRLCLRQRISSRRVTVIGFYPVRHWYHPLDKLNTLGLAQENEWRASTAIIRRIHERTYYGSRLN